MNKNNEYGFTLVELLAVIVILAIILVIAVPKVMDVINDAKKATLESTAKMIASQAEKQKVQNTVLGNTDEITCKSITNINDVDYVSCGIAFENDTAKVTIEGSGKFEGLYICSGTKTEAVATEESCPITYGKGTTYIEKLLAQESELENGLFVDDTEDQNIRYRGANPNNSVYFNCKDTYDGKSYGSEGYDYASACETWRIIGVFDTKTSESDTTGASRIKIIRESFPLGMSWDSSTFVQNNYVNVGMGINQWGKSGSYEGADLMRMLNGYYISEEDSCIYCDNTMQGECINDCSNSIEPLSALSLDMVDSVLWNVGAIKLNNDTISRVGAYNAERGTQTGKICTSSGEMIDNCNDTVTRTTIWEGKIGLIYPSDYAYASTRDTCSSYIIAHDMCRENNWLHPASGSYWSISSDVNSSDAYYVYSILSEGGLIRSMASFDSNQNGVRPTLYLSPNIQIIGGNGNDEPFRLSL